MTGRIRPYIIAYGLLSDPGLQAEGSIDDPN
jgi:hypothetical protein